MSATGTLRPTFTFTATAGSFEIDAANVLVENVRFVAGISAVVVGVNVDADGVTLRGCEWSFSATGYDFVIHLDATGVDYVTIEGNRFIAETAAGADTAIQLHSCDHMTIVGNYIYGDFAKAAIIGISTSTVGLGAAVDLLIDNNRIYNADAAAVQNGIDINVATTGMITNNRIATLMATDAPNAGLDPGSCLCTENYVVNAVDEHGVQTPPTSST